MTTNTIRANELSPLNRIDRSILLIRDLRVMIDADLAVLYGVTTKRFNEQVKRNIDRFPPDFMFRLTKNEMANLRSQFATSSLKDYGGRRYLPYVFTEYGAIMVANIINSRHAIEMSILVVRAFIRLRNILATHMELAQKISDLERQFKDKTLEHAMHINKIYKILDALMMPLPEPKKERIGFDTSKTRK